MKKNNEPAFPQEIAVGNVYKIEGGLTKREYLAMKIYAKTASPSDSHNNLKNWAKYSVLAADILLEVLGEENEK